MGVVHASYRVREFQTHVLLRDMLPQNADGAVFRDLRDECLGKITQLVKLELEDAFPLLWVEGEISNLRRYP